RELDDCRAVRLPLQVWLGGYADDQIALERSRLRNRELGGRPDDFALRLPSGLEAHGGPRQPGMVEVLRIDFGKLPRVERGGQVPGRRRRRLGRVVPAAEGRDENGPTQSGRLRVNREGTHRCESTICKRRPLRSSIWAARLPVNRDFDSYGGSLCGAWGGGPW